jgi:hypothetical protein
MQLTKKKTAIMALALIFCIGIASAALLEYYGRIITTVTVDPAIFLDDNAYPHDVIEEFTVTAGDVEWRSHHLDNKASVPITMKFNTTFNPELTEDEITVTYLKPVGYSYSKDFPTERGTLHVTVTDDGEWLTWTYTYAEHPTHTPKMTVAINYPNGFCITTFDDGSHDGWYYAPDGGTESKFAEYSGGAYGDWVITSASNNVLTVAIKKSALPDTFLWHGYANYNGIGVWIEIDTTTWLPKGSATIREPIPSPFTLEPGGRLDFYIRYEFCTAIDHTIVYTITTTVEPV